MGLAACDAVFSFSSQHPWRRLRIPPQPHVVAKVSKGFPQRPEAYSLKPVTYLNRLPAR